MSPTLVRILIILFGIVTGVVIFIFVINPFILKPLCLTGTNTCVRMMYYNYKNSVLINMLPTGYWIWYNGAYAYVYGQPSGQVCIDNDKYEAAYKVNAVSQVTTNYECVTKLEDVIAFYRDELGIKEQYIYTRPDDILTFDVYDVLNLFNKKHIINIYNPGEKEQVEI